MADATPEAGRTSDKGVTGCDCSQLNVWPYVINQSHGQISDVAELWWANVGENMPSVPTAVHSSNQHM
jgi:hypothetical protein